MLIHGFFMPDEYGREFNEHGQRYVGSVSRGTSAGTQGYWSTDSGRGPNWELIFAILYGSYKLAKYIIGFVRNQLAERRSSAELVNPNELSLVSTNLLESNSSASNITTATPLTGTVANPLEAQQRLDISIILDSQHLSPLAIARVAKYTYKHPKYPVMLVDYGMFRRDLQEFVHSNRRIYTENEVLFSKLINVTVDELNSGRSPSLRGQDLISFVKSSIPQELTKYELVMGAGFVRVGPKWKEVLCFKLFYEELLRAKGLKKLDNGSIVRIDDEGISPSEFDEQLGSAKPLGRTDSSPITANQSDHIFEKFTIDNSSSELVELLQLAEKSLSQHD